MLGGCPDPLARASLVAFSVLPAAACTGRSGAAAQHGGPGDAEAATPGAGSAGQGGRTGGARDPEGGRGGDTGGSTGADAGVSRPASNCTEPAVGATPLVRLNRGQY